MPVFGARWVMSQTPSHVQEFNKTANEREELLAQRDEKMRKRKEKLQILHEQISTSRRNSAISNLEAKHLRLYNNITCKVLPQ